MRTLERQLHDKELQIKDMDNKISLQKSSEENIATWRHEIELFQQEIKVCRTFSLLLLNFLNPSPVDRVSAGGCTGPL
jgi:hypothetical protein